MRAFITGVTGFVGSSLARQLAAAGHEVRGSSTRGSPSPWGPTVGHRLGDAVDDGMLAGADVVVHAAYDLAPGSASRNVAGTMALAEAARALGVANQVFISSYSAHPAAVTEYGRTKLELQEYFLSRGWAVAQLGLVIGRGGIFASMAQVVKNSLVVPVVYPSARVPVVAIRDVEVAMARMVAQAKPGLARLYLDQRVSMGELLREIRRSVGSRARLVPVPYSLARAAVAGIEAVGIRAPLSGDNLRALRANQSVTDSGDLGDYVEKPLGLVEMVEAAA